MVMKFLLGHDPLEDCFRERTLAKDLDGKTITIMLLVIAFTSFAITRSLLYHECQLKNDMTLFPEAWRLREEPLSRVISAAPVARDWLVAQLRESLAVMPSCRSLSRALAVDAAEIRLFRAARPTFVRISALAAKALHANLSVEVTQLKAAQKIKMLAEEVLRLGRADLSALRAREPEFAKGDDPEALDKVLEEAQMVLQLSRPCGIAAFHIECLIRSFKKYHQACQWSEYILQY
ncbi:unnamed protein product [Symbiodinium natans]|uniref:Uncharacterized protein n=1 Tax=Symbiodinium natans TaxID=878477 RepID=A0A812RK45_9DINO|nr:unnamed protein product [Symbiodinium natans]